MVGHKVVPSRRGGIENVLTTLCPLLVEMGHDVTCYNRSSDKVENEYVDMVVDKLRVCSTNYKNSYALIFESKELCLRSYSPAFAAPSC